jgi:hypothetical protein
MTSGIWLTMTIGEHEARLRLWQSIQQRTTIRRRSSS